MFVVDALGRFFFGLTGLGLIGGDLLYCAGRPASGPETAFHWPSRPSAQLLAAPTP
jgi:hypothetical protein